MNKKLIIYDMKKGYLEHAFKLVFPILIAIIFCIDFDMNKYYMVEDGTVVLGDFLIFGIGGMKPYVPSPLNRFEFPIRWVLYYSMLYYSILPYIHSDMHGMGKQLIVRANKRGAWWNAKITWSISFVLLWSVLYYVTTAVYCIVHGTPLKMEISPEVAGYLAGGNGGVVTEHVSLFLIVLPVCMAICMVLLEMCLTLFIKSQFSFFAVLIYMIASAYSTLPILAGNYLMPLRCNRMIENGFAIWQGFLWVAVFSVICIAVGQWRFKKYNIL